MKNRPTATEDEIIDLCISVLENDILEKRLIYARECAAVELANFDRERVSVALAKAWSEETNEWVRKVILKSLERHENEVAQRLVKTLHDEIDEQRGILKLKLAENDS